MRRARIAVVGAGWWANTAHLPALAADDQCELVAVCDRDAERATRAARRFGASRADSDLSTLLTEIELDGVVVATPHTSHAELARTALHAGAHVLVEKPMTTSGTDAWELVQLARAAGLVLAVGVTYLYADTFALLGAAVRAEIGELVAVNAEFSSNAGQLFAAGDEADARDNPTVPHASTYSDPALSGGGQGQTQLTHLLTALMATTGQQAVEVSALMDRRGLRVDVVDALAFRLTGGALATAGSTGTTPPGVPPRQVLRYHGTDGMVEHDILRGRGRVHLRGGSQTEIEPDPTRPTYPLHAPAQTFVRLVLDGGPNPAAGEPAAASAALLESAYRAAATGAREPVLQDPAVHHPIRIEKAHAQ